MPDSGYTCSREQQTTLGLRTRAHHLGLEPSGLDRSHGSPWTTEDVIEFHRSGACQRWPGRCGECEKWLGEGI